MCSVSRSSPGIHCSSHQSSGSASPTDMVSWCISTAWRRSFIWQMTGPNFSGNKDSGFTSLGYTTGFFGAQRSAHPGGSTLKGPAYLEQGRIRAGITDMRTPQKLGPISGYRCQWGCTQGRGWHVCSAGVRPSWGGGMGGGAMAGGTLLIWC